jgi:hypothetical protein
MEFQSALFGSEVQAILGADGDGLRPIPLLGADGARIPVPDSLRSAKVSIFPAGAPHPEAALAGLWMYFGRFHEAHTIAQDIPSVEGSYWHAMLHRQEPDNWNAKYWLRRVDVHPIHHELAELAAELPAVQESGLRLPDHWDPMAFADLFDRSASDRNHRHRQAVEAIQLCEWQLLFRYCALPK